MNTRPMGGPYHDAGVAAYFVEAGGRALHVLAGAGVVVLLPKPAGALVFEPDVIDALAAELTALAREARERGHTFERPAEPMSGRRGRRRQWLDIVRQPTADGDLFRREVLRRYARLTAKGRPLMCGRKVIFDSRETAEDAEREMRRLGCRPQRAYPCPRSGAATTT